MEKSQLAVWVGLQVRWDGISDHQSGAKGLARLLEFQIWNPHAGSVALCEEESQKGQWPLPTFLSEKKLSSSSHLDARQFSSSLYATGAFQASTSVLELRGSKSE